ncbi:Uncharacterised protein [Staphylococcus aureus]|nr:Uncharacterised protein [Staphylococcus aureus]
MKPLPMSSPKLTNLPNNSAVLKRPFKSLSATLDVLFSPTNARKIFKNEDLPLLPPPVRIKNLPYSFLLNKAYPNISSNKSLSSVSFTANLLNVLSVT